MDSGQKQPQQNGQQNGARPNLVFATGPIPMQLPLQPQTPQATVIPSNPTNASFTGSIQPAQFNHQQFYATHAPQQQQAWSGIPPGHFFSVSNEPQQVQAQPAFTTVPQIMMPHHVGTVPTYIQTTGYPPAIPSVEGVSFFPTPPQPQNAVASNQLNDFSSNQSHQQQLGGRVDYQQQQLGNQPGLRYPQHKGNNVRTLNHESANRNGGNHQYNNYNNHANGYNQSRQPGGARNNQNRQNNFQRQHRQHDTANFSKKQQRPPTSNSTNGVTEESPSSKNETECVNCSKLQGSGKCQNCMDQNEATFAASTSDSSNTTTTTASEQEPQTREAEGGESNATGEQPNE